MAKVHGLSRFHLTPVLTACLVTRHLSENQYEKSITAFHILYSSQLTLTKYISTSYFQPKLPLVTVVPFSPLPRTFRYEISNLPSLVNPLEHTLAGVGTSALTSAQSPKHNATSSFLSQIRLLEVLQFLPCSRFGISVNAENISPAIHIFQSYDVHTFDHLSVRTTPLINVPIYSPIGPSCFCNR